MTKTFPAVVAKTADYTIKPPMDRDGTLFTNRGATAAVVFTLPAPGSAVAGYRYVFQAIADYAITVKTSAVDTLISLNDATADSVSAQTGGGIIGARIDAICDGTSWIVNGVAVGYTYTLAT